MYRLATKRIAKQEATLSQR